MLFNTLGLVVFNIFSIIGQVCCNDSYKVYNLESDKVCSLNAKYIAKRISTASGGLIVKETSYFDNLSGKNSFTCRFEVETQSKSQFPGLFAVVQKLHLRQDPDSGDCIDYVKFRPVDKDIISEISNINFNFKQNKFPWTVFCGDLQAMRDGNIENPVSSDLSKAGFISNVSSVLEVEIFISKTPKLALNESLELQIAFTPYTSCTKSWSEFKDCGMNQCIKKQSFRDGVVNCPFLNCPDEEGCDVNFIGNDYLPSDLGMKVTLTAVTSIFCSFFLFISCIWCCRYFELLCWSANTLLGRPSPVELSPMTAPSSTSPSAPSATSKDLPPAYETLFPDR